MSTTHFENRRTLTAALSLAGALAFVLLLVAGAAHGAARTAALYPRTIKLTDDKIAHWAVLMRPAVVRAKPGLASRIITKLPAGTTDGTQNDVLVLSRTDISPRQSWYRVRLPILPNNTLGYMRTSDVSPLYSVNTHLYINRAATSLTLKRNGKVVFRTRVGVGKSYWPTPAGEFYVRDKLTNFGNPFYGPVAFGISARSAVLTDWPGGGYVGIHGTNQPQLIPGHISHGCIRLRNPAILALARLMKVGSPVSIR
ncbi:MAG: L,D-transpeptidase family protein [Gaiellaceae bacterium]